MQGLLPDARQSPPLTPSKTDIARTPSVRGVDAFG